MPSDNNQAVLYQADPDIITFTGTSAGTMGDIMFYAGKAGMLQYTQDSGKVNELRVRGLITVRKAAVTIRPGGAVGWDKDGTSYNGKTGGAATSTVTNMDFALGRSLEFAGTVDNWVVVDLNNHSATGTDIDLVDTTGTFAAGDGSVGQLYVADASTGTETTVNGGTVLLVNTQGTFGVVATTEINHNFGLLALVAKRAEQNDQSLLTEVNAIKASLRAAGIDTQYSAV